VSTVLKRILSALCKGIVRALLFLILTFECHFFLNYFISQRGDGFPLANMLALVSAEAKDVIPVLTAHIYTVCPTAIPSLPHVDHDATEEQLMESLGMLRGKDGEFETFERFLARTEV